MVEFHFKGRYTLRDMCGTYYLYDRQQSGLKTDARFKPIRIFSRAKAQLEQYKKIMRDN